jgi:hypothetical protein
MRKTAVHRRFWWKWAKAVRGLQVFGGCGVAWGVVSASQPPGKASDSMIFNMHGEKTAYNGGFCTAAMRPAIINLA